MYDFLGWLVGCPSNTTAKYNNIDNYIIFHVHASLLWIIPFDVYLPVEAVHPLLCLFVCLLQKHVFLHLDVMYMDNLENKVKEVIDCNWV